MDKLDKLNYYMVTALLSQVGFRFESELNSGSEIWSNSENSKRFQIPRCTGVLPKQTLYEVLDQAGLTQEDFLKLI